MNESFCDKIRFKEFDIFYRIHHSNEKTDTGILFFHGKISHSEYIESIIDSYQGIKIFAFDYPGQGRSSGKSGHCNIYKSIPELTISFVENVVKKHSISKLYLIGESLGALISFFIYSKNLLKDISINGLILLPGIYRVSDFSNKAKLTLLFILSRLIPGLLIKSKRPLTEHTSNKEKLEKLKNDIYFKPFNSVTYLYGIYKFFKYFQKHFSTLQIPVLLFQGKQDYYSTVEDFPDFHMYVLKNPKNKIIHLENSKHWLLIGEDTDIIKNRLFKWIKSIDTVEES